MQTVRGDKKRNGRSEKVKNKAIDRNQNPMIIYMLLDPQV